MARRPPRQFRFTFLGWQDGWYVLRLRTERHALLDIHAFRNRVLEWLIEQTITPNVWSYMANGNTGDGPPVPAAEDGSVLCLLFRRAPDVLRFQRQFGARGITPEAMFEALRAEASVHRWVSANIARVAYDSVHSMYLTAEEPHSAWERLGQPEQDFFLVRVRDYMQHADTPARAHEMWVDRRLEDGWRYASDVDLENKRHPALVPYTKLPEREQAVARLIANTIMALAPLLHHPAH